MSTFLFELVTPQKLAYSAQVESVSAPGASGTIGILSKHVPLFTKLTDGEVKINTGKKMLFMAIGGGFLEVAKDRVSVLVSRAVNADEINEAEIKKAMDSARDAIKRKVTGEELEAAQAVLRRSILDLKIVRRRRKNRL
ncbi:ATP synthase F1 subunit epsilon [Patescibacteria group bacterium]